MVKSTRQSFVGSTLDPAPITETRVVVWCRGRDRPVIAPMTRLESALQRVAADLAALQQRWALVGGLAVSARAEPRTTRDVDIAVGVADDAQAESLIYALQNDGYKVVTVVEQEAQGRLATARLLPPGSNERGVLVDLLFASSGIEPEIADAAEVLAMTATLSLPVARIGHLIATKVLAREDRTRPQDLDDIHALLVEADADDVRETQTLLSLITKRGFHRGKNLSSDFDRIIHAWHGTKK